MGENHTLYHIDTFYLYFNFFTIHIQNIGIVDVDPFEKRNIFFLDVDTFLKNIPILFILMHRAHVAEQNGGIRSHIR